MKYPNGVEVKIGDKVRFERGETSGTVEAIIESNFGVDPFSWTPHG
jgi:hypothetical protein